jgi:hypothetical protein
LGQSELDDDLNLNLTQCERMQGVGFQFFRSFEVVHAIEDVRWTELTDLKDWTERVQDSIPFRPLALFQQQLHDEKGE